MRTNEPGIFYIILFIFNYIYILYMYQLTITKLTNFDNQIIVIDIIKIIEITRILLARVSKKKGIIFCNQ